MDNESFIRVDVFGNKYWYKNGIYHRLDGPAREFANGTKAWYVNGELHREDGPAVTYNNGTSKEWFKYGKLHRDDGPAIETSNVIQWYKNGLLHRLDGPAIVCANGERLWYKNGRRFKNKDTFFRSLNKKEKEIALFSEDFLNG